MFLRPPHNTVTEVLITSNLNSLNNRYRNPPAIFSGNALLLNFPPETNSRSFSNRIIGENNFRMSGIGTLIHFSSIS